MKVLIVGGGGREHALAWKLAQSPRVDKVYVAPGNAGTAGEPRVENIPIKAADITALLRFAQERHFELTIVGPEVPLVAGIVDQFTQAGLRCFGPVQAAARLEGSKVYAKDFLSRHHIPTAEYETFTDLHAACAYLRQKPLPIVIKADGLASGKGVIIARTGTEAEQAVRNMLEASTFGKAGSRVVIEEFLRGEEASFIVMADGRHYLPLATSQDHKALRDGDHGPNTGGMGAYSPAPVITPAVHERVLREVIEPTLRGMAAEGHPYTGFLYAGLMISPEGKSKVLEFNCRLGDPETQPILMRLRSDLVTLCEAALDKKLDAVQCDWDPRVALGVVLAAEGYPGTVRSGDVISGLNTSHEHVKVFHAGTVMEDGGIVTAGGRVLCVCALGDSIQKAQQHAYEQIAEIRWHGMQYRRDIGHRGVTRESGLT